MHFDAVGGPIFQDMNIPAEFKNYYSFIFTIKTIIKNIAKSKSEGSYAETLIPSLEKYGISTDFLERLTNSEAIRLLHTVIDTVERGNFSKNLIILYKKDTGNIGSIVYIVSTGEAFPIDLGFSLNFVNSAEEIFKSVMIKKIIEEYTDVHSAAVCVELSEFLLNIDIFGTDTFNSDIPNPKIEETKDSQFH